MFNRDEEHYLQSNERSGCLADQLSSKPRPSWARFEQIIGGQPILRIWQFGHRHPWHRREQKRCGKHKAVWLDPNTAVKPTLRTIPYVSSGLTT
jgi:hypothetical protein